MMIITTKAKIQQTKSKFYKLFNFKRWLNIKGQWTKGAWVTGVSRGTEYPLLHQIPMQSAEFDS